MRTMSLYELGESNGGVSLTDVMNQKEIGLIKNETNLDRITELIISGGWPATLECDSFDKKQKIVRQYLEATIEAASSLENVRKNKEKLWLVMKSLARNESTLASAKKIHSDTGIDYVINPLANHNSEKESKPAVSYVTVNDYIDLFDRMYLINNQPPFDPKIRSGTRWGKP